MRVLARIARAQDGPLGMQEVAAARQARLRPRHRHHYCHQPPKPHDSANLLNMKTNFKKNVKRKTADCTLELKVLAHSYTYL